MPAKNIPTLKNSFKLFKNQLTTKAKIGMCFASFVSDWCQKSGMSQAKPHLNFQHMKRLILPAFLLLVLTGFVPVNNSSSFSDEEITGIRHMREEEKMAHDVYVFLAEKWDLPAFDHISNAETRHFSAMGFLIEDFGIDDPAQTDAGKFQDEKIAQLYNSMTEQGSKSLIDALKAGAYIEEVDIADLHRYISETNKAQIKSVYQNLLGASGNHLRTFTRQLEWRGEKYTPVVLDSNVYAEIISATPQRGGSQCMNQNEKDRRGGEKMGCGNCGQGKRMRKGWNQ